MVKNIHLDTKIVPLSSILIKLADFIYLPLRLLAMSGANLAAILDFLVTREVENAL